MRLIFALIVIAVFAQSTSTSLQFNALDSSISVSDLISDDRLQYDENPNFSRLMEAIALSKTLANRYHTKIDRFDYVFDTTERLRRSMRTLTNGYFRILYLYEAIRYNEYRLRAKTRGIAKFAADNEATIATIFGHILGNDETKAGQLNAQIIRHQLFAPMKVIQSLLSFTIDQHADSNGFHTQIEAQSFEHVIEQLKYKAHVIAEVHDDFDFLLRQESTTFFTLKRAMSDLMQTVNELLTSKTVPKVNLMSSLLNKWQNLPIAIENEKSEHLADKRLANLLDRMLDLTKCTELGIAAYKECRQNPTKLAAFSAHVRKYQDHLLKWERNAHKIYAIVVPVLRAIEQLPDDEYKDKFDALMLSFLPKLNSALYERQQLPLWNTGLYRAIESTRQLNRQTIGLLNGIELSKDRKKLFELMKQIGLIYHKDPKIKAEMEMLNDQITANLMLEACKRAREALKAYVFAIDQDYLEICDVPAADSALISSNHVNQTIHHNLHLLDEKIAQEGSRDRRGAIYVFENSTFTNERPFFVWRHADFKIEIAKILSGETVTLNADILSAPTQYNAIKFSKIIFDFRFADKSKQAAFYKVLHGLRFQMDMVGYNYYCCDKRIYYVPNDSVVTLIYEYHIVNNKVDIKGLYPSVLRSRPYLSPYNTWQLKISDEDSGWIGKLKQFIGEEIDLQVIGFGSETMNEADGKAVCYDDAVKKNYARDVILN